MEEKTNRTEGFGLRASPEALPALPPVGMEWLVDARTNPGADITLARMTLAPGCVSERHAHPNADETVYLISGSIELIVEDARYKLHDGDHGFVPRGSRHCFRNLASSPAVMILGYSHGMRIYEPHR